MDALFFVFILHWNITFSDLAQIIKIYCGYNSSNYDFQYYTEHYNFWNLDEFVSVNTHFNNRNYDEIRLSEYFEIRGGTDYVCGPIKIHIYRRNIQSRTKVYPEMYNVNGVFPTEDEIIQGESDKDMETLFEKGELKEVDEKLKEYFKKRYVISDDLSEFYDWRNAHKLKLKN